MNYNNSRYKGNEFKGLFGGKNYNRFAKLLGFTKNFYRKAVNGYSLTNGMKALDLGCGTGALCFALAEKAPVDAEIVGVDISETQLRHARLYAEQYPCIPTFIKRSMDELSFPNLYFDLVVSSMALHETPPDVRRKAIKEVARVLKQGGLFIYTDWSKPRLGLWGLIWYPMVRWGNTNRDNWENVYPKLCKKQGLKLIDDAYINSIARRQIFQKV